MADIHSFESLAAVDGEGIRFDVFFSGCPLIAIIPTHGIIRARLACKQTSRV